MKILSIIGTRPQYVKIKPIFDYCNENGINHIIVDTNQHYSESVSDYFIEEFSLRIDHDLKIPNNNEVSFITQTMERFVEVLKKEKPDFVLIYGDTNSTLTSSLVCYKLQVPFAHVESGLRCGDISVPEELNRIVSDITSKVQFTPSKNYLPNLENGIVTGDLEYELLNTMYDGDITHDGPVVMTIHRQRNLTIERFNEINRVCEVYGKPINLYLHHRTRSFIKESNISLSSNIKVLPPAKYGEMVKALSECSFIITDSGGLTKTSPFFGKKCIMMRDVIEWKETEQLGYCRRYKNELDLIWADTYDIKRDKGLFLTGTPPSQIINNEVKKLINE